MKKIVWIVPFICLLALASGCRSNPKAAVKSTADSSVSSSQVIVNPSSPASSSETSAISSSSASIQSASAQNTYPAPSQAEHVALTVNASKGNDGIILNNTQVDYQPGDTAYSVLERACKKYGKTLATQKTGQNFYVQSIDGVAQFNFGAQSGWLYKVNGAFPSISCNKYTLKPGDSVTFIYTTDMGKSEGSPQS